ncbi:specific transcription factor domain protein [Aspergillus parasiticus SU-1]|uniref:Specific transcription factor domain protein n=2 Tax=Aspergillus parasiticus TaxID=5067 RepID=A0A5N6E6M0_ASPPA|nr:hypothetical protein BDV34DRAFT_208247 [Aspergillus parasiticus]KJK63004.1 specific transcription factor domain protein [Aspergillus parasiticus SU-1]
MPARRNHKGSSRIDCGECKCQRAGGSSQYPHLPVLSRYMCSRTKARLYTSSSSSYTEASSPTTSHCLASQYRVMMEDIDPVSAPKELNMEELELMIQWCTETYRSISRDDTVEWVWRVAVPREAMRHPFLMHGILALSALHLTFNNSGTTKESHLMIARSYRSQARVGLEKVKGKLNDSNSNAVFALYHILIVFAFALPLIIEPHEDQTALDELCEVFRFTKALGDSIPAIIDRVKIGEMKELIESSDPPPRMPDTSRLAIMALLRMNAALTRQNPEHECDVYSPTIKYLGESLDKLARGGEIMVVAFQWIFQIPPRFVDLLRERQPFALIVLGHFAVILHSLREHWWMGEWGARLIRQIGQHLDMESKQSLNWVLDATGCYIPPR